MKTYQKLIAYPLIAVSLASGAISCGEDKKQISSNKHSLERCLESSQIGDERQQLRKDYIELVSELTKLDYDAARRAIQRAESKAKQINPKCDFNRDLVEAIYNRASALASYSDNFDGARKIMHIANLIAKENGIETKEHVKGAIGNIYRYVAKEVRTGGQGLVDNNLDFAKTLAQESGIDTKEFAESAAAIAEQALDGVAFRRDLLNKHNLPFPTSYDQRLIELAERVARENGVDILSIAQRKGVESVVSQR